MRSHRLLLVALVASTLLLIAGFVGVLIVSTRTERLYLEVSGLTSIVVPISVVGTLLLAGFFIRVAYNVSFKKNDKASQKEPRIIKFFPSISFLLFGFVPISPIIAFGVGGPGLMLLSALSFSIAVVTGIMAFRHRPQSV